MSRRDKLIYTAGPYTSDEGISGQWRNIQVAREWAIRLWQIGATVICPHLNTSMFDDTPGVEYKDWLEGDFVMLRRCDALFLLPRWDRSPGTAKEIQVAHSVSIPVFEYTDLDDVEQWLDR